MRAADGKLLPGSALSPGRRTRASEVAYLEAVAKGCPPEAMTRIATRLRDIALGEVPGAPFSDQIRAGAALAKILVPPAGSLPSGNMEAPRVDWSRLSQDELRALLSLYGKASTPKHGAVEVVEP